jgi:pimeloyl-ACP methyl ester carboxylesterase
LVGHSYGAFVAAFCAFKHPELVKNLVLIEPFIPTLLVKNLNSSLDKLTLLLRMPSVALAAQKLLNGSTYPALKELDRGNGENGLKIFVNGLQQKENGFDQFPETVKSIMLDNKETIKELKTKLPSFTKKEASMISQPALLISGTNTSLALSKMAEILSKKIIKSQLTRITNSAHFPQLENPQDCNSRIKDFLSR